MTAVTTTAPFLASTLLDGVPHGFFTRQGGASCGLYESLNCGPGSGDDPAAVAVNRSRVTQSLLGKAAALCTPYQVHGREVAAVTGPWEPDQRPSADALVTDRPGIVLGILTADCGPVLFADRQAGVIGAAHAGWQGALKGVLAATIDAMEALGAQRSRIRAALGPTIAQASYEVSEDFRGGVLARDGESGRFFAPSTRAGHSQFDLPGFIRHQLTALGLAGTDDLALDTYRNPARFFSYRRATHRGEADYGRQISVIALP